jgi:two-component system, LuxR family, response regulator FixJ
MLMNGRRVVSIVDDDECVRESIDALLRSAEMHVDSFASAEEFLGSGRVRSTECLILDLRMPGMDGLQLQQRLIDDGCKLPIVILTAHGDGEACRRAPESGAVAFLKKPFDSRDLLATVDAILSEL